MHISLFGTNEPRSDADMKLYRSVRPTKNVVNATNFLLDPPNSVSSTGGPGGRGDKVMGLHTTAI